MSIQRFLDGVSNVTVDDPMGSLPFLDPIGWSTYFMDMHVLPSSLGWTLTNTNGAAAVIAGTTGTGVLTLTCAGADNDLAQIYATTATWALVANKRAFFETRIKVDKATGTIGEQEVFVGMAAVLTGANFTAADGLTMTVDDAVGFWSPDGSAAVNCITRKTDVESSQAAAFTMADVTYYVLSWYFDGTRVKFYKDDTLIGTLTNYPTAGLSPTLYIKAGEAKGAVLSTDYVFVAIER